MIFTLIAVFFLGSLVFSQRVPRKMITMEIATSTLCTYCPGAAMGAEDMLANDKYVAVIENHCNGLGNDIYSNAGARSRESLYSVTGYPTATFDGVSAFVGGSHTQSQYSSYLPKYNARIAQDSPIDLNMTFTHTDLHYTATITVTKVDSVTPAPVLFFFVTESNIACNWEGQHWLHFVNRLMVPDKNGTAVSFATGNTQTYTLTFDMDPTWILGNCEFVATVQNMDASQGSAGGVKKREEYQTIKSGSIPLSIDFTADKDTIDPGESIQFTNQTTGGYVNVNETFEWHFPGAIPAVSNDTNPVVQYPSAGNYDVKLIVNRGGEIDTVTKTAMILVNHGVGIKEQAGNQIVVSPNPGHDVFKLTFSVANSFVADLSIVNTAGKTVYSESNVTISNDLPKTIRVNGLTAGQYFLTVQNGDTKLVKTLMVK